MEVVTCSPEKSQPNGQKSEGILTNATTTVPGELSAGKSISGAQVSDLTVSEDWEIVGYLNRDQIDLINGMDPKSDQETLKAYKEIEWLALYFKTFTCSSGLPLEIRRKIWLYALPEPRLVNLELDPKPELALENDQHPEFISIAIRDYTLTTDDTKDRYMSLDIRPFFLTCHEFKDVFLEYYKSFDIHTQIAVDGDCLYTPPMLPTYSTICLVIIENPPSQCYIDPRADCPKFDNLKESIEILSGIGITLDFSALRHIAIAKYSKFGNESLILESTWKAIEDNFPQLKSVTLSGNNGGTYVNKFPMGIPTVTRFHRLTEDTISEFYRQTICQYYNGLAPLNACIVDAHYMDIIWKAAYRYNESFLERTNINGDYWKGVNLTTSLWMEHTLHRAKDYIQLKEIKTLSSTLKQWEDSMSGVHM
ncbi:hypothetical protein BTUL_0196g00190 [Botrytis tulipae]|uniref:2EXR domain-containing protein n=1 Tax=Botrytis tulipae TaxID=87230 RepID=A0A4Z1EDJ0_9HELO|nr:hypothetical protein BTUL_0196g00190 [Botrytis tulipae]